MARQRNLNNIGVVQNALYPDPIYNNQLQNESFSDLSYQDNTLGPYQGGMHPPRSHSGLQSVMPHNVGNWRDEMNPQNVDWSLPYQPDRPFPHAGMQAPGFMEEPSGVGEGYDKRGFNFPNFGVMGLLKNLAGNVKDQFQYKGATEELWDPQTGQMISAEEQDKQNALGGGYSAAAKHARLQDKRVMRMLARKEAGKGYSETNLKRLQGLDYGPEEKIKETITDTITPIHHTGGGDGGNQMAMSQMADRGRARRSGETGQIAGGHHFNQGGRAGYQGGELVEQETDFIEGPQGGEEFQETVVEGQDQPSREQLEALAMEIFQLPLEELDEQQLLVVYQEAMQGQPMEESVQEDEVQFAAQGGLAGLL